MESNLTKSELNNRIELSEKISDFNRINIPERVTHSKGTGAFGEFLLTQNLKEYTTSKFFSEVGKRTKVLVRFSNYKTEKGSPDTIRDLKGFAAKFYTDEGIWDFTGNHLPVFFINDPIHFIDLASSHKKNPKTNLYSDESLWNFYSSHEESVHLVLMLYSERGIPKSFRFMDGFSTNAYSFINSIAETYYVKFHFKTLQGIQNLSSEEAEKISGIQPDYYSKDLVESIECNKFPKWELFIQILSKKDLLKFNFNPFDSTKVWSKRNFPEIKIGELVLNQNIKNYFEEIESAAFSPKNILDGMSFSPDKLLKARLFAYSDAQRYRLGKDYSKIEVNQNHFPKIEKKEFNFDIPFFTEQKNFFFKEDNFSNAKEFFNILSEEKKEILYKNLIDSLKNVSIRIKYKQIQIFYKVNPVLANHISEAIGIELNNIQKTINLNSDQLELYLKSKNESLEKIC